jgi:hypothetical protein
MRTCTHARPGTLHVRKVADTPCYHAHALALKRLQQEAANRLLTCMHAAAQSVCAELSSICVGSVHGANGKINGWKLPGSAGAPVRDGDDAVRGEQPRLEDVHVLAADGVVQPEHLPIVPAHLRGTGFLLGVLLLLRLSNAVCTHPCTCTTAWMEWCVCKLCICHTPLHMHSTCQCALHVQQLSLLKS